MTPVPVPARLRRLVRPVWRSRAVRLLRRRGLEVGLLGSTEPVSRSYGYERGTPVARVYVSTFLEQHADDVRGRALEVQDSAYVERFGGGRVTSVDVLDVDPANARATVRADLDVPGSLPAGAYDCIVLTQVLQFVEPVTALRTLYAALAPGGVLLLTVPAVGRLSGSTGGDRLRFLPDGVRDLLEQACPEADSAVTTFGNVLTAVGSLLGLAAEDLDPQDVRRVDPHYPVLVCARVRRP